MESFSVSINSQYIRYTSEKEIINGEEHQLHEVQKRLKLDFNQLPEFTIITAPTGTGKSYSFPFPVLKNRTVSKYIDDIVQVRGLIVLPTNALINELTENFRNTYSQLKISPLTGSELNKYSLKGHDRWIKAIEIAENSDLVITNPDIINYAMHGGYQQWTGKKKTGPTRFSRFLGTFNYIIFDEYHLYDEAQIANILTLVKLREYFLQHYNVKRGNIKGVRFLFVSATPEEGLKKILESEGYEYEEIVEEIIDDSTNARPIHGTLDIEFVDGLDIKSLIREKIPELRKILTRQKALLILDRLRDVQELAEELQPIFPNYTIYQSTGYVSNKENHIEKINSAQLIIATNKAEVGVNYDVEYCIMQPGKYFQNFVQRLGRISRGDLDGKVVVCVGKKFSKLRQLFKQITSISYYDFINKMRKQLQGRKFYEDLVPTYLGEYIWCISNKIRRHQEFNVARYFSRRLNEEGFFQKKAAQRFFLFQSIHKQICKMMALALNKEAISQSNWDIEIKKLEKRSPRTWEWAMWWKNYLDTYLSFREGSKVVKIYDRKKDEEIEYSLEWILQHKVIQDIKVTQKEPYEIVKYTVGDLKEQDKDLQYTVSTIPNMGVARNNLLSYQDIFELDGAFRKALQRICGRVKKGVEEIDLLQLELIKDLEKLAITFDRKRLKIESIDADYRYI